MPAASGRTITTRELNRALLARQLLLERSNAGIPAVLEGMGGLQAQYAPSMYVGLWTRMEGFERDQLTRALERRSVVQGTLMRVTIHLVSKRDYWPFAVGVRRGRRAQWLRARQRQKVSDRELAAAARRLRKRLRDGPMTRKELDQFLGKGSVWTNGINMWLDLLRIPPSGTWEHRRADLYASAEVWIGPSKVTPAEGIEHLVRRYLGGFGPSSQAEIADWAGLRPKEIGSALKRLSLRRFVAEDGEELLDLPRAPLPDPDTPAPVRFLPIWDATLLVHARRTGILPEEHRSKVFNTKTPQSVSTFLVDGVVAGTWSHEKKGRVRISPFGRLDRSTRREVDQEAERLWRVYE
jgi:DNA glycosylase AlkZ-like